MGIKVSDKLVGTLLVHGEPQANMNSQNSPWPGPREKAITFLLLVFFVPSHMACTKCHFVLRLPTS